MFGSHKIWRGVIVVLSALCLMCLSSCGSDTLNLGVGDGGASGKDASTQNADTNNEVGGDTKVVPDGELSKDGGAPGSDVPPPPVDCSSDADCAGETPCGVWTCGAEGICVVDARVGETCDDLDACTTGEVCNAHGSCAGGADVEIPDNPCESCSCDPQSGVVCTPAPIGASCSDGDCCSQGDHCAACDPAASDECSSSGRICVAESQFCDDSNPCTADVCSCDENQVPNCTTQDAADGLPCDYNPNDCTTGDHCNGGVCVVGTPQSLEDQNPCTQDLCVKGEVVHTPVLDGPCSDGNVCTTQDHCYLGTCVGGEPLACTIPTCGSSAYCTNEEGCAVDWMPEGAACDDGNPCTDNDRCGADHACAGDGNGCNDFNPCTKDNCDPNTGCTNEADPGLNGTLCTLDYEACGAQGYCTNGICSAVENGVCDDSNPCTEDACVNGQCTNVEMENCCSSDDQCADDDLCTADVCEDGVCTNTTIPDCCASSADCEDSNACTEDSCDNGVCSWSAIPNCCTTDPDCDDNDPCTADTCVNEECTNVAQDVACDDGDPCTSGDTCKEGECVGEPDDAAIATIKCNQVNDIDTDGKCCCWADDPTGVYKSAHVLDLGQQNAGASVECCLTPGFSTNCSDMAYFAVSSDGSDWTTVDSFPTTSTKNEAGSWTPYCTTLTPDQDFRYVRGANDHCYVDRLTCDVPCADEPAGLATVALPAKGDTWLESSGNFGSHEYLIVGRSGTWPKKRSLIKFDTSSLSGKTIQSATLWIYYRYAHAASWMSSEVAIDRVIGVHQVLVPWEENVATKTKATAISNWSETLCGVNDTDAASTPEDAQLWVATETKQWNSFDITALAQKWLDDADTNLGVLLRAENEDSVGRGMRMYSRNATEKDDDGNYLRPYLEVTYQP